jgi:hypothetical protein
MYTVGAAVCRLSGDTVCPEWSRLHCNTSQGLFWAGFLQG